MFAPRVRVCRPGTVFGNVVVGVDPSEGPGAGGDGGPAVQCSCIPSAIAARRSPVCAPIPGGSVSRSDGEQRRQHGEGKHPSAGLERSDDLHELLLLFRSVARHNIDHPRSWRIPNPGNLHPPSPVPARLGQLRKPKGQPANLEDAAGMTFRPVQDNEACCRATQRDGAAGRLHRIQKAAL